MKLLIRHIIFFKILIVYAVAGAVQPTVDTLYVNMGEKKTFFIDHNDTITSAYMWYINDTLKKDSAIYVNDTLKKENVLIFTDSVTRDYKLTVVPISKYFEPGTNSRILGDTFTIAVKVLTKSDNHLNAATTSPQPLCFVSDTAFDTVKIDVNLINHVPLSDTEKFKVVYAIANMKSGSTMFIDTIGSKVPLKLTVNIDSRKLGYGTYSFTVMQLYYGIHERSHIDYTVKAGQTGGNIVSVEQTLKVGLKPVIGKIKTLNNK